MKVIITVAQQKMEKRMNKSWEAKNVGRKGIPERPAIPSNVKPPGRQEQEDKAHQTETNNQSIMDAYSSYRDKK